jgi:Zn-dependent protease
MLALAGAPVFGWAKPVPVVQQRLRNPRFGMMAVAAAGPLTNFMMAAIGALAIGLLLRGGVPADASGAGFLLRMFSYFFGINVFVGFFNLLPFPPFDGSHIVEGLLPRSWAGAYARLRPIGFLLFFGLVLLTWFGLTSGILGHLVDPPVAWMIGRFEALVTWISGGQSLPM